MKRNTKKPTNKDLVYNIALNKRMIIELNQQIGILESVINKYLQDQFNKEADEETKDSKEIT